MAYDPNKNYADEISAAIASGAPKETVEQLNAERNEKIAANQAHYDAKGIGANDQYGVAAQNYIGASQTPPQSAAPAAQAVPQAAQAAAPSGQTPLARADTSNIRGYLEQARDASVQEASGRVDRAVTQGVNELRRVQEDALEQYRTQQDQANLDERRGLDNRALYDAMRGDRGGIGGEQYSSIMAAAAQNRVAINNARTKLQSDVGRQMAELRANGEFEKSQAYLQATQEYLGRIAQLEQWEQEFNVGVDQFNAQMEQAERQYQLQLRQLEIATDQWEREFQASRDDAAWARNFQTQQAETAKSQWQQEFDANRADAAWSQNFQTQQAETAKSQWRQEFDASKSQWQQEFDANRDDTAWSRIFQQGQADFQQRQYADSLADKAKQDALSKAEAMMNVGMMPDEGTLKAAGLSKEYAKLYISSVNAAKELASAQAAAELENKRADTLKKASEASQKAAGASGDIGALAKAFVESGSNSPKTWLANNYKTYGFTSKPDAEEFADAVEEAKANTPEPVKDAHIDFSPDEGTIKFDGQTFQTAKAFAAYVNGHALTESDWETLMRGISRWPELKTALRLEE